MAITITSTGAFVVLDETDGLQNEVATPSPAGDADDNDISSSSLPTAFSGRLSFYSLTVDEAALSGYNGTTSSNIIDVTGATASSDFALTAEDGVAFPDYESGATSNFSSGLFAVADDGTITEIFLFTDPTNNNIVYGVAGDSGDDPIAFAIYLEEVKTSGITTGAKMWTVIADGYTIAHDVDGSTVADHDDFLDLEDKLFVSAIADNDFSFANAPSGQNLFMMFGNTSQAILITGEDPANQSAGQQVSNDGDTVSSSQGGGPTTLGTEGQHIKAQKALVITFVTGANPDYIAGPNAGNNPGQPLSPTEANVEANIDFGGYTPDVRGGEITISQMNPGNPNTTATVEIEAYLTADGTGTNYINNNDPLVTGDAEVDIESVHVIRGGVDVTGTLGVTVTLSGNSATITGVKDDDVIQYTTTDDHNRVLVRNDQPIGSNVSFDLGGFSLRQVASDVEEVGSKVRFEDDGPAIDLTSLAPTIAVDESVGTGGSSKDEPGNAAPNDETTAGAPAGAIGYKVTAAATLFSETVDAGEDGEGGTVYSLVLHAGATGLTDTATGSAVVLSLVGGVVQGRTATGNHLVFTIEVASATGNVTTTLFRALDHGADSNNHDSAVSMASGLVELQATLTDGDGDTGSDKIELGSLIDFEDDGPAIDLTSLAPTIAVDESVGTGGSSKDEPGNAAPNDETTAGAPAGAIGYKVTAAATLFSETVDAGSDGQDGKAYSLVLNAGATGLTDTASGQAVVLSLVGGVVQGRTATGGDLVFTIAVASATGDVTTTLFRALNHGADSNNHDSAVSMASGLVELQATLTDGDTDTGSDKIELGSLIDFEDDGPAIDLTSLAPTIAVDESVGTGGSSKDEPGNAAPNDETTAGAPAGAIGYAVTTAATLFSETVDAGSDGQAGKAYSLVLNAGATGLTDTATGSAVVLSLVGGVVQGRTATGNHLVFTIAVASATGDVTTTLFRALDHGADLNDHDSAVNMASGLVELQATLADGDTDTGSDKIELGSLIDFEDDGPAVTADNTSGTYAAGAQGTWSDDDPGSDGFASLSVTFDGYEIDANGAQPGSALTQNGLTFTGSITDDFNGDGTDETMPFSLTFDRATNTYVLTVTTPPPTVITFDTSQGSLKAGGPDAVQTLLFGGSEAGADDIVFFGVVPTAPFENGTPPPVTNDIEDLVVVGATDLTEAQIEALLPLPGLITPGTQMNVSTSGIGVNNNNLNGADQGAGTGAFAGTTITSGDESFVVNPETVVDKVTVFIDNSVGGYNPATEDLYFTVYFTDGSVQAPVKVTAAMLTPVTSGVASGGFSFEIDGGAKQIDAVQLTMGKGTIKVPVIAFSVEQVFEPEPLSMDFTATLFDGDGDSSSDSFTIDLVETV